VQTRPAEQNFRRANGLLAMADASCQWEGKKFDCYWCWYNY